MSTKTKPLAPPKDKTFTRNKWIFSTSGIGRDMSYALFSQFLLTYILYTRNVTTSQFVTIGAVLTACRIWDALNDPIMGGIVEATRTRFGKFKPWIFIGCITNSAVLIAMFSNRLEGWNFVYLFVALYLLWDITYTMNDIGYWSMMPSLAKEADKRNQIASMTNLFSGLGAVLGTGLIPVLTAGSYAIGGNSITAYKWMSIIIAAAFIICQGYCCLGVKEERNYKAEKEERIGLKKIFTVIFKNDQLLWATLVTLLTYLMSAILTAFAANYIYLQFGYSGLKVTLFTAFYAISTAILMLFFPKLSKKYKRAEALKISMIISIIGYLAFIIGGTIIPLAYRMPFLCASVFVVGLGQNWFSMIVMIIFTNTIEYNEYKTGSRDEALIFSLRPFMSKMSSALQQVIVTLVYLAIGMTTLTNKISDFEQQANLKQITEQEKLVGIETALQSASGAMSLKLALCMAVIPIILLIISYIILAKKNKIDEEEYDRMLKEIEARKGSSEE